MDEPTDQLTLSLTVPVADDRIKTLDLKFFLAQGWIAVGRGIDGIIGWPESAFTVDRDDGSREVQIRFVAARNTHFIKAFVNDGVPFRCHASFDGRLDRDGTANVVSVLIEPPLTSANTRNAVLMVL